MTGSDDFVLFSAFFHLTLLCRIDQFVRSFTKRFNRKKIVELGQRFICEGSHKQSQANQQFFLSPPDVKHNNKSIIKAMVKQKLVFQNPNNSNKNNNTKAKAQKKKTQSTKQQQQQQQTNEKIDEATTTTTPELITTTTTTSPTIEVTMTLVDDDHHSDEDMSATSPTPTSTTTTIQQDVDSDNIDDTIATSVMSEQSVLKQLNQLKKKLKKYSRLEQEV